MASPQLVDFLNKLNDEIFGKGPGGKAKSDIWRSKVGNKRAHTYIFDRNRLNLAMRDLLNRAENFKGNGMELRAALLKLHTQEYQTILQKLETRLSNKFSAAINAAKANKQDTNAYFEKTSEGFRCYINEDVTSGQSKYAYIAAMYKEELQDFYDEFLDLLGEALQRFSASRQKRQKRAGSEDQSGMIDLVNVGDVFNLEHVDGANIEHLINSTIVDALNEQLISTMGAGQQDHRALVNKIGNEDAEWLLELVKNAEKGDMTVAIGGRVLNAIQGATDEAAAAKRLKQVLESLGNPAEIPGSDSLVEGRRKKVVKATVEPFIKLKGKNIKVEAENYVIDNGVGKMQKKYKRKIKVSPAAVSAAKIKQKRLNQRPGAGRVEPSFISLIGIINEKLPRTVIQNMGDPRLNNRTGRFAQSVRITDVARTSQGYPSIGYTYQKNPYQTFEMGQKQGSIDLDPRRLIDVSIREIATGMALGRFYTRRV